MIACPISVNFEIYFLEFQWETVLDVYGFCPLEVQIARFRIVFHRLKFFVQSLNESQFN